MDGNFARGVPELNLEEENRRMGHLEMLYGFKPDLTKLPRSMFEVVLGALSDNASNTL